MKQLFVIFNICIIYYIPGLCQKDPKEKLMNTSVESACKCIDSINVYNKSRTDISNEVGACIDKQSLMYQMADKMLSLKDIEKQGNDAPEDKNGNKEVKVTIEVNGNPDSQEYKKYYYAIERQLMANCKSLKEIIASNDKQNDKSMSKNPEAMAFYNKGYNDLKKENYKDALKNYEKAVKIDPEFAFAWDNIGLCQRKLGNYDLALSAYNKSVEIDPKGLMPLLNIAVVYQYKKEYTKAIEAYQKVTAIEKNDPEIYYGIGQIYAVHLKDLEKGLDNMCIAYNLYIAQKSPYRTDAEKLMTYLYNELKKEGKEDVFNSILKKNNINTK